MNSFDRPKIDIPKSPYEIILNGLAVASFLAIAIYLAFQWETLPETIPAHFNTAGEPDGWVNKWMILLLPFIGLVLWVGLSVLERHPHIFNYPVTITKENAESQYKNARIMINVLKNEIAIFFVVISWISLQVAIGEKSGLGPWGMPIFLIVIFGSMLIFVIKSFRLK